MKKKVVLGNNVSSNFCFLCPDERGSVRFGNLVLTRSTRRIKILFTCFVKNRLNLLTYNIDLSICLVCVSSNR
eukprot:snap_masked-scaffold_66-processed-gene-0.54-mRNA-1 protein AED:1.00 eAED:1.00 QI:0/0/0/0/1/1/2/0/72